MIRQFNGERLFYKWCWNNWIFPVENKTKQKTKNCGFYFTEDTDINSKYTIDLNVKIKTIKNF